MLLQIMATPPSSMRHQTHLVVVQRLLILAGFSVDQPVSSGSTLSVPDQSLQASLAELRRLND
jgi:hypothetical protein